MQTSRSVALEGGVDLVSPAIAKDPAHLIGGQNYEPRPEGYRRMNGIERYDGQQRPSRESYWTVDFAAGNTEPGVGRTAIGGTSGATGTIMAVVVESGSFVGADAAGYIVIRSLSGAFEDGEALSFSAPVEFSSAFSGAFQ